jgi:hypothetical protein
LAKGLRKIPVREPFRSCTGLVLGVLAATAGPFAAAPARADESPFASIYLTDVLPQGAMEVEQWVTWKHKKPQEQFDRVQGRTEFEYGFSNRFMAAAYANYEWTKVVPDGAGAPDGAVDRTKFTGFSAEFIYQVLNPFTDPIGFALYAEPAIGDGERELEFKLLFQKNFMDDRLIVAANFNLEFEWEYEEDEWERESALEVYLGAAYRFAPGWYVGAELLNENAYEGHVFSGARAETNAFYLGPAVHYASQNWWATLAVYAQMPWAGNPSDEPEKISHGYLVGAERMRLRFRFGVLL